MAGHEVTVEGAPVRGVIDIPRGWDAPESSVGTLVAVAPSEGSTTESPFRPNVVVTLAQTNGESGSGSGIDPVIDPPAEAPERVIGGIGFGHDTDGPSTRVGVTAGMGGHLLGTLARTMEVDGWRLSVVCLAGVERWSELADDFDAVVDSAGLEEVEAR